MENLTATADELRLQMPTILAAVETGNTSYTITKHGRPVGQLVPVEEEELPGQLMVVLYQDGDSWLAQGVELDYLACGDGPDDVVRRFVSGLAGTLAENLRRFGSVDRVLGRAPTDSWAGRGYCGYYLHVRLSDGLELLADVFSGVDYMSPVELTLEIGTS